MSRDPAEMVRAVLEEEGDGALLADGFDAGLVGVAEGWFGNEHRTVALYDRTLCQAVLEASGMDEEEAAEHLEYNVTGAYVGGGTPVFATFYRQPAVCPPDIETKEAG